MERGKEFYSELLNKPPPLEESQDGNGVDTGLEDEIDNRIGTEEPSKD